MEKTSTEQDSVSLSKIAFFTSVDVNIDESDQSSIFTLKSEQNYSVDFSEFPHLSKLNQIESDSNQSSQKNNSGDAKSANESIKAMQKFANYQEFEFVSSSNDSKSKNYEDEDTDNEEDSESVGNSATYDKSHHEKDIKTKGCCLCLIL